MTLPTLTWTQSATLATGSVTPTNQQVLATINTLITASTYWRIVSSTADYLEIAPKLTSAIPNFRALVTINPTTGYGVNAVSASGVWCGIAPDGGTLGSYQSATPYGADRFSLYWLGMKTAVIEDCWIVESDEILFICGYDSSSAQLFAIEFGAIIEANGLRAEADERIFGMTVSGTSQVSSDFVNSNSNLYGFNGTNNTSHTGIFRPSAPSFFDTTIKPDPMFLAATSPSWDVDGKMLCLPFHEVTRQAPYYAAGKLRQHYTYKEAQLRQIVSSATGVVGYCISSSTSSTNDAIILANQ